MNGIKWLNLTRFLIDMLFEMASFFLNSLVLFILASITIYLFKLDFRFHIAHALWLNMCVYIYSFKFEIKSKYKDVYVDKELMEEIEKKIEKDSEK